MRLYMQWNFSRYCHLVPSPYRSINTFRCPPHVSLSVSRTDLGIQKGSGSVLSPQGKDTPKPSGLGVTMSDKKTMTLKVKLLRSRKLQRVICLECGKEFADLLLSLLVMPVGTILKHLGEGDLLRSDDNGLFNLYKSMKELEASTFIVNRESLIDPVIYGGYSSDFLRLTIGEKDAECLNPHCGNKTQSKGIICDDCEVVQWNTCLTLRNPSLAPSYVQHCLPHFNNQTYVPPNECFSCGQDVIHHAVVLRRKGLQTSSDQKTTSSGDGATRGGGFVEKNITFMVKEDLSIIQSSALSALSLLQSMKSDFSDLDMKVIDVGKKEGLLLIRAAMVSKKPLTDVFESFFT